MKDTGRSIGEELRMIGMGIRGRRFIIGWTSSDIQHHRDASSIQGGRPDLACTGVFDIGFNGIRLLAMISEISFQAQQFKHGAPHQIQHSTIDLEPAEPKRRSSISIRIFDRISESGGWL